MAIKKGSENTPYLNLSLFIITIMSLRYKFAPKSDQLSELKAQGFKFLFSGKFFEKVRYSPKNKACF